MENVLIFGEGKEGKLNVFISFKRNLGDYEIVEISNSFSVVIEDKKFEQNVKEIVEEKIIPSLDYIETQIKERERRILEAKLEQINRALDEEKNPLVRRRLEDLRQQLIMKAMKLADDVEWFKQIQK